MSVQNRLNWQRIKEQARTLNFWLQFASVLPMAIGAAYLRLGLFYSYLIAPNGELVYLAMALSGLGLVFTFRAFLRHVRRARHAREMGAPRVPSRYWLGICMVGALFSLDAGVVPLAVHYVVGVHMSKREWKDLVDAYARKEMSFLPGGVLK